MVMGKKHILNVAREQFVWEMRCKGFTQRRIVEEMAKPQYAHLQGPLTQQAICQIIKRVEKRTLAKMDVDVEMLKRRQTAMLERSIEDLRDAYDKSTQAQVHQKKKTSVAGAGSQKPGYEQNEVGQKTQVGDHSILREIRETAADIRKIWGADAPIKTDASVHGSMLVTGQDLSALTDDELETLRALQQKMSGNTAPPAPPLPVPQTTANS